jgi:hypothetical protein
MNAKIDMMNFGLTLPALPVLVHNFTEKKPIIEIEQDSSHLDVYCHHRGDSASSISEDDEAATTSKPSTVPICTIRVICFCNFLHHVLLWIEKFGICFKLIRNIWILFGILIFKNVLF